MDSSMLCSYPHRMFEEAENLWRELIRECNLDHLAEKLIPLTAPAVGLSTKPCVERDLPAGTTKIGGHPDLAPTAAWPTWHGTSLSFIAQINLADLAGVPFTACLPSSGLLSFFYHPFQETWGYNPGDKGSFAVIYNERPSDAAFRDYPADLPKEGIYPCCSVNFGAELSVPKYDSLPVKALNFSHEEMVSYMDACMGFNESFELAPHRLLGHPHQVQNEMSLECELVSNGIDCGTSEGYEEGRKRGLESGASNWQFLLEIGTDGNSKMMWGDAGSLYFWIKKQDLADRKFENCWMILQCC